MLTEGQSRMHGLAGNGRAHSDYERVAWDGEVRGGRIMRVSTPEHCLDSLLRICRLEGSSCTLESCDMPDNRQTLGSACLLEALREGRQAGV